MKYEQKRFSVYLNSQPEPRCLNCGQIIKTGVSSQLGLLCWSCYSDEKKKKEKVTLQKPKET